MSVLIKGMKMPRKCAECYFCWVGTRCYLLKCHDVEDAILRGKRYGGCPLIELHDHGDLIDRDAFRKTMYHDAFETDSDLQKWESGCWIRYKMFERNIESAPVVIPAERSEE